MGLRLIRNRDIIYRPETAGLGVPLFPDFGDRCSKADVDPTLNSSHEQNEVYRQAYREGYASGYALSWAIQRRRAASLLKVLERIAGEVKEHTARGLRDVEGKTSEIATVIAANIAANDTVAHTQARSGTGGQVNVP